MCKIGNSKGCLNLVSFDEVTLEIARICRRTRTGANAHAHSYTQAHVHTYTHENRQMHINNY